MVQFEQTQQTKESIELEVILSTLSFKQIKTVEIQLLDSNTSLFIIGNGFDLIHGVPSSYYNFRDFIGRNSILRFILDTYIEQTDVWGAVQVSLKTIMKTQPKNNQVLAENQSYLNSLDSIKEIIVIGQSLSNVDYPYFKEIIKNNSNGSKLKWFISWYDSDSLKSINKFVAEMQISTENVNIFRAIPLM